ncbi:MAG: DegT/DnrJ/EryC1/StrS family aminotransferase [Phycisphaerae bacterium]|nr:DegT/DnrJ/EryC1/StrS family aminotransferase [Phycisphaerae bacterium]
MSTEPKRIELPREFPGVHYYGVEEEQAVLRVIRQRSPFRYYGANFLAEADSLEKEFAARLGRKYVQAVSSCTNALACSLAAFGVGPGQEVIVPGFFWVATVGAIVRSGAIPVLVEIDDSYTIDPADLQRKITDKTGLILPVHMCGVPTNMPAIMEIARARGVPVLEDCAQANGATLGGKQVGTFGEMAVFSFQMNKNITAGEGGMIVTDDEKLYLRANAAHDLGVPWVGGQPVQDSEYAMWGAGARMSEIGAAVVRAQLPKLDTIVATMRKSKYRIRQGLGDRDGLSWRRVDDPAGDSGPFLIAMFDDPGQAARFAAEGKRRGLICSHLPDYGLHVYYNVKALVQRRSNASDGWPWTHPANAPLVRDYAKGALPQTDALLDRGVALAVPSKLTLGQEGAYLAAFEEAFKVAQG